MSKAERPIVLVVDDDANARLMMRAALQKAGCEVRLAESGERALELFDTAACDLVMLDVEMPEGIDGYETCIRLRQRAGALLPIMMVTGMDDVSSVQQAYDCGATDFIAKPVNWALIGHRVRYLLRSHRTLLDLQAAESRNAALLDAIPDLLFELDLDGRYLDFRAPRATLLAAPPQQFLGRTIAEVLPPAVAAVCQEALREAHARGHSTGRQYRIDLPAGPAWFELSIAAKRGEPGEAPRFIALARNITDRKLAEDRISRLAYFDSLTGLPNRRSFLEVVERRIRRAQPHEARFALLFIDLDGFKTVNDTMGHAKGDQLLTLAAERLREGLRPSDLLSRPMSLDGDAEPHGRAEIARLGGDEFTALLDDVDNPRDALVVAERVGALMRKPFDLGEREVALSASVGLAFYPDDGHDAATLLQHADTAMYEAKRSGRDRTHVYSAALTAQLLHRVELERDLRSAIERNELHLVY